ncbi:MAG: Uma2 family endonuclease [Acidobacteria bacterium]|nr:Uma2 family endonuclease [Acidobacteriota bacterium]
MPALKKKKKYTAEEYLALEEKAEFRSEYDDGVITAMAGGSLDHARIVANLSRSIGNRISGDCSALTSDLRVRVENYRKFYYPDVLILCGEPAFYEKRNDTVTNPVLIVEVLSKSTEAKDRGEKMLAYRTLESLREYVLISQDKAVVEQYTKTAGGDWIHKATIGLKSRVKLESVGVELGLEEVYQRVKFEE